MKQVLFILAIAMATVFNLQAGKIDENRARQVADKFFNDKPVRMMAQTGQHTTRLAFTAEQERFYVFDRGNYGGYVVVAGDDRLPGVLAYSEAGEFSVDKMPSSMRYWMDEMNRQIEFLESHDYVGVNRPKRRPAAVEPLLTTQWDQTEPYNNYCPTYSVGNGNLSRAVTGCVATAMAQVMNYHQWPAVGRGSHSYTCNVNNTTMTQLSADFSQSVYRWDLMLDRYDVNSSPESCDAVARLMSDAGISVNMSYGSSSGASESLALASLKRYFDYYDKSYMLHRDFYSNDEWDQIITDELSAHRPILYCGGSESGAHAFVFDGFDADGYFHVNWGWGGSADGYFLFWLLNPSSYNFSYFQDAMMGLVPSPLGNEIPDVLYVRSALVPRLFSAPLGKSVTVDVEDLVVEGNLSSGYNIIDDEKVYYIELPMSLGIFDSNNIERNNNKFIHKNTFTNEWTTSGRSVSLTVPTTLEDGEYKIKMHYSLDGGHNYDHEVTKHNGQELYIKMIVRNDSAYLMDCFLSEQYSVDAYDLPSKVSINQVLNVDTRLAYYDWGTQMGPAGNIYLAFLDDNNQEVTTSDLYRVQVPNKGTETYQMQIQAPAQWGRYDLAVKDEYGNVMIMTPDEWSWVADEARKMVFVFPPCQELVEDFETMAANSSTSDKNVVGRFAKWSFNKSGVRAPGEGRCNGTNSVMMKKPSTFYTTEPLSQNFFLAQATFFNSASTSAKYNLDYSVDGGTSWQSATTIEGESTVQVPEKSQTTVRWLLNLSASQPATFRIAMVGGGTAATYVDDFALYYIDMLGDVNGDGEINIADVNAVIGIILDGNVVGLSPDVNSDGEVNIADVNTLLDIILE